MKTLVIHPKDYSTDFLSAIYKTKEVELIDLKVSQGKLESAIRAHDRVIMLGHGDPMGMYGFGEYVNFEQHYSGDEGLDNLDAWTWKYSTIQVIEDVKECIKELEKHTRCQCLYEIENNLPRTKFCMVPCKAQRESRKLNR